MSRRPRTAPTGTDAVVATQTFIGLPCAGTISRVLPKDEALAIFGEKALAAV